MGIANKITVYNNMLMDRLSNQRTDSAGDTPQNRVPDANLVINATFERCFVENVRAMTKGLTRREAQILSEVMKGSAIKEIAEAVNLSTQGVKAHLTKLFRKFQVTNRSQLILAVLEQVTPLDGALGLLQESLVGTQKE